MNTSEGCAKLFLSPSGSIEYRRIYARENHFAELYPLRESVIFFSKAQSLQNTVGKASTILFQKTTFRCKIHPHASKNYFRV